MTCTCEVPITWADREGLICQCGGFVSDEKKEQVEEMLKEVVKRKLKI